MRRFLLVGTLLFFPLIAFSFSKSDLPKFTDFPVIDFYKGKIAPIDLKSHPEAYKYRTHLKNETKKGVNFAGHYIITSHGCGTNCYVYWIINAKTGKVINRINSELGASYKLNSSLLILNPSESVQEKDKKNICPWAKTNFFILKDNQLKHLLSIKTCALLN